MIAGLHKWSRGRLVPIPEPLRRAEHHRRREYVCVKCGLKKQTETWFFGHYPNPLLYRYWWFSAANGMDWTQSDRVPIKCEPQALGFWRV